MTKILFLLHSYYKYNQGGAEQQIKYIASYLITQGFEVHYLFLHPTRLREKDGEIHLYGIPKKPYQEKLVGKLCYYTDVIKDLKEIQPDIIYHRNLSNILLPAIAYAKDHAVKTIIHLANLVNVEKRLKINKMLLRNLLDFYGKEYALKSVDHIIAQAKYQDQLLLQNFQRHADLILPNVHPLPQEPINKKAPITVLWVANFKAFKQPDLFIDLVKAVAPLKQTVRFKMIGRNKNSTQSAMWKQKMAQVPHLEYTGELSMEEVNHELAKADIFVNTSLYEGFPNTFIQAWMREVPVVSLHVNPDQVLTQEGIGFHSQTFEQMVLDLTRLIDDSNLRASMGKKARQFAQKTYSIKNLARLIPLLQTPSKGAS